MKRLSILLLLAVAAGAVSRSQTPEPSDSLSLRLREVVVEARQPATRLEGTTLVSTIAGSNLSNLGSCLDVLAQLPMLSVVDGGVEVLGRGTPEILIDGRPLQQGGEELLRLRSSDVVKVELLMAPGAEYESTTKAVLKITTRRRFIDGLSLTESADATMRRRWSFSDALDLNYRSGRWDFFANASASRNNSLITGSTINIFEYEGKRTIIGSRQHHTYPSVAGSGRAGVNYSDSVRSLGAYYRLNPESADYANRGSEWLDDAPEVNRDILRRIRACSHLVSVYYDETFVGKYNLHFDGNFRSSNSRSRVLTVYPGAEVPDVASRERRVSSLWAGKLVFAMPLLKGDFKAGTQDSYTRTSLDYRMLNPAVESYIPSSLTESAQTSLALFASWSRSFGNLALTAGLRFDHVDYSFKTNGVKDRRISRTDNLLTPDLSLSWNFSNRAMLSLSYRNAIVRPPYAQLSGSLSYVGMHEIEGGNPALRDERMHDLTLLGSWGDFILQADFTRSNDTYAFVKRLHPSAGLQLIMQPVNIDVSALDVYLVWSRQVGVWSPDFSVGMHRQWLELDGVSHNRPIFSYFLQNVITLPMDFTLSVNAYGQTGGDIHTNRFGATVCSVGASVGKFFCNKSLQLKLSAADIFNSANNDWTMRTYGIRVDKRQRYDRRGVSLSLTYRFQPRRSKYKGAPAADEEMKRL